MTCKIDHTVDGAIPPALCRACNPRAGQAADIYKEVVEVQGIALAGSAETYRKKRRRKLRAEVKERSEYLDKLRTARAPKSEIDKAERGWKYAYTELATLEDTLE